MGTSTQPMSRTVALIMSAGLVLAGAVVGAPAPAAQAASAPVATTARQVVNTKRAVKTKVKVTARAKAAGVGKVRTTAKITVAAKRTTKTKKAVVRYAGKTKPIALRWSKGAYRGTYVATTKKVGKLTVSVKGASTAKVTVARASTRATWSSARATLNAGQTRRANVTVSPAYGRTVYLERRVGAKWVRVSTHKLARKATAKVSLTLRAGTPGTQATWRVRVPATSTTGARTSAGRVVVTRAPVPPTSTPAPPSNPSTGTPTPTPPTSGPSTSPTPSPSPSTAPPTYPRIVDGVRFPAPCGTYTVIDETSEEYWVQRPLDCAGQDSIRTVLDAWTVNPLCGVTQNCADRRDAATGVVRGKTWNAATAPGVFSNPERLIAPNWLAALNAERAAAGVPPVKAMPFDLLSTSAPVKSASTTAVVRQNGRLSTKTFTAPAQGGFSQYWADWMTTNALDAVRDWTTPHSCGNPAMAPPAAGCAGGATALNADDEFYNTYLPADQRGYTWGCAENNAWMGRATTSANLVSTYKASSAHWASLMNPRSTYASFGASIADDGRVFIVTTMCRLEPNGLSGSETAAILDSRPDYLPVG